MKTGSIKTDKSIEIFLNEETHTQSSTSMSISFKNPQLSKNEYHAGFIKMCSGGLMVTQSQWGLSRCLPRFSAHCEVNLSCIRPLVLQ